MHEHSHEHSQRERRVEHFQCPSSMGCVKYMHDVADTCDNGWCIARGGAWWFDYGFIGNIRCARVHVWFRIAIDGVHYVVARDVRDALDGDDVCVRCGIYGVLGSIDVVMGKLCGLNDRPSCMLCDNVVVF